uniref:Uncharacterized protein n=1 Tax=Anopheles culicifacies TaxID=139723 RepID=A0A182MH45_9DIPT
MLYSHIKRYVVDIQGFRNVRKGANALTPHKYTARCVRVYGVAHDRIHVSLMAAHGALLFFRLMGKPDRTDMSAKDMVERWKNAAKTVPQQIRGTRWCKISERPHVVESAAKKMFWVFEKADEILYE